MDLSTEDSGHWWKDFKLYRHWRKFVDVELWRKDVDLHKALEERCGSLYMALEDVDLYSHFMGS